MMAKPTSLWEGNGETKPYLHEVHENSDEWRVIEKHLWQLGGSEVEGLRILKIERNENWHLYSQYRSYRNGLEQEGNEKYLFHGSPTATYEIMDEGQGLDTAYASQARPTQQNSFEEFNVYGVGNYFAADLRLSLWFIRGQPGFTQKIILCQVACGRIGERERVVPKRVSRHQWIDALARPQNKLPPKGCQSATSRHRKELVVYKHNHAYPAYKITLRHAHSARNPYASPALLKELRGLEDVPYPQLRRTPQPSKKPSGGLAPSSTASPAQTKEANSGYMSNGSQDPQLRRSPLPSPRPSGCLASSSAPSLARPKSANSGYMSNGSQDPQLRRSPLPSAKPSRLLASSSATSLTLPKAPNSGYMSTGSQVYPRNAHMPMLFILFPPVR
eukprot:Skav200125  [mRNA]  locus=scaffold3069:119200:121740:+ [translate_table: standard]